MIRNNLIIGAVLLSILAPVCIGLRAEASDKKNQKSIESYVVPDVVLTDQDGMKVNLKNLLQTSKTVLLDFIYSSCTTTCPVLSADYVSVQRIIAPDTLKVQLISISIDPERDTPQVMKGYLKRYGAKPGWVFLTGSIEEIGLVMKAFRLKEMSYNYFTLIRTFPNDKWTKINGHFNAKEIQAEYFK